MVRIVMLVVVAVSFAAPLSFDSVDDGSIFVVDLKSD
jgi:hypothetical protein